MKRVYLLLVLTIAGFFGCGGDSTKTPADAPPITASSDKKITAFAFTQAANATLSADANGGISGTTIAAFVPVGTAVTSLIPTFTFVGVNVTVAGIDQTSAVTPQDFTNPVTYVVTAMDGSTQSYIVTVTVPSSSAKDITAFSFTDAANIALSADVTATITGTAITATVPTGTDVTALIATYATTGATVKVGSAPQASNMTANNFASPVTYVVTAGDGSTQSYTVTVTVAASTAKDITAFAFGATTATITGTAIAATVPTGTNVTALIATFATTGTSVSVGSTPQVSGTTPNDFTNPVMYVVKAADNSTQTYTVTVTIAASSAKDITAFSVGGVAATITGTAIAATLPAGTNVTALIATFSTSGTSVAVGSTTQVSGTTPNDFTNPVSYVVKAADNSTQTYTVTVTVALSATKDLTAFSLGGAAGTIAGTSIAVALPTGTAVTALVATFTTTGASVSVGATQQVSGTTANDFTNPVMYVVKAADASTKTYTVTVTVAASTAKDITAFSVGGVAGTITGTSITVTLPSGTAVTALVATFTTTGASVSVGATTQVSGTTANDFTSPVMYVVKAADSSTKTYTVTVTVAMMMATTIPDGTYDWTTWICTDGTTTIDIKAFAMSFANVMDVHNVYAGSTGAVDVIYSATCTRDNPLTSITYPTSSTVQTMNASMFTCSAGCAPAQCTAGSQTILTDTFNFTLTANGYAFNRVLPSSATITLQSAAGCMAGWTESGTDTKL